jgi:hypothetical protein
LTAIQESTAVKKVTAIRAYKLHHPKCGNTWVYKGRSPFFATCTWCGLKIFVAKHRIDNLTGNGHGEGRKSINEIGLGSAENTKPEIGRDETFQP